MADPATPSMSTYFGYVLGEEPLIEPMIVEHDTELTYEVAMELVEKWRNKYLPRLEILQKVHDGYTTVFAAKDKPAGKPDNRMMSNFPKYLVNTFNGFFIGNPVNVSLPSSATGEEGADISVAKNSRIQDLQRHNRSVTNDAVISKNCDIFGTAFEMLYHDENGRPAFTSVSPLEAFVVYDDTILHRPKWGFRVWKKDDGTLIGSVGDEERIYWFDNTEGKKDFEPTKEEDTHSFGGVTILQYRENEEYRSLFEDILSLSDSFSKVLSEKANDVDYFSDAYLKILGAILEPEDLEAMRDNRVINMKGNGVQEVIVDFLERPSADNTQEHFLDRVYSLIFSMSMVSDVSDVNFVGNASGVALEYKLLAMSNLAMTKQALFEDTMRDKWSMICGFPQVGLDAEDALSIEFNFTRNLPANLSDEADTAGKLEGIVSKQTQLSTLSIVENPVKEIAQINAEKVQTASELAGMPTNRNRPTMYQIKSVLTTYQKDGNRALAKRMLTDLGLSDEDAEELLNLADGQDTVDSTAVEDVVGSVEV